MDKNRITRQLQLALEEIESKKTDLQLVHDYVTEAKALVNEIQENVIGQSELLLCDCEPHTFYDWEKEENKCVQCKKQIFA